MTPASQQSMLGLSLNLFSPLVVSGELISDNLAGRLNSYRHTSVANGGYQDAEITVVCSLVEANDWIENGLFRHLEVYDGISQVFEGFINEIELSYGDGLTLRRGPLMDIANRVRVAYQTLTINVTPPIPGGPAMTADADNADSQAKYGVWEIVLSGGSGTATLMTEKRDTYLGEYAWPETSPDNISLPFEGGNLSLTLRLLGYRALTEHYVYNQTASVATTNASDKIEDVLGNEPNSLLDNSFALDSNTLQVGAYEDDDRSGWQVIKDVVSAGDSSDNRWLFGFYNQRQALYQAAPVSVGYQLKLVGGATILVDHLDDPVSLAAVRPGRWLLLPELLSLRSLPTTVDRQEPRLVFIEAVTYDTPPGRLSLTGTKITRGRHRLARLGLENL